MKHSPITGVFGHRQVGKTTLIQDLCSQYQTLDLAENLALSESDPSRFLALHQGGPLAIDECQYSPALFPAMKDWVRRYPKPGQLLLSGSVRFSSRKVIRESLTGRLVAWELLPMDLSELHGKPLPDRIPYLLRRKDLEVPLSSSAYATPAAIENYGRVGGLPGVAFLREASIREQKYETQINTILERDLKLLVQTSLNYRTLRTLLSALAQRIGSPLDWASLSRETRISVPTVKKLLDAFESMYLIRVFPTSGSRRKPVVFFEDAGEARFLAEHFQSPRIPLLNTLFSNFHTQVAYRPELAIKMYQYRTRGGVTIPLCFRSGNSHLGVLPLQDDSPNQSEIASARSFVRSHDQAKVLLVHTGSRDWSLDKKIRVVSASQLL
jgi:predicted AAA+ superfamily ATPase